MPLTTISKGFSSTAILSSSISSTSTAPTTLDPAFSIPECLTQLTSLAFFSLPLTLQSIIFYLIIVKLLLYISCSLLKELVLATFDYVLLKPLFEVDRPVGLCFFDRLLESLQYQGRMAGPRLPTIIFFSPFSQKVLFDDRKSFC